MNWTRLACRLVFMLSSPFPATASCLPSSTPEAEGIPSSAVLNWIDACEREIDSVHGFVLLRHGRLIAEGYWAPFSRDDTHMLYSHSKSFTSAAVGLLVDDGRLDLDEAVADFFPDKLPPNPSPGLLAMRVRDLLTMASGHDRDFIHDTCAAPDGDWLRHFFNQPLSCKPGTRYVYNTTGVYVLGAIVEQRAGEPLMDFLEKRLFSRIGIVGAWSTHCPKGHAVAGYGMNMRVRDLARFGQILLQKGVWRGERVLSEDWVTLATAKQIAQGPHPNPDWGEGYGFQFWRCVPHGVYRADGALGQFTIVMPDQDAVLSMVSRTEDTQRELAIVWETLLPAMGPTPLPPDPAAKAALDRRCASLRLRPVEGAAMGCGSAVGRIFALASNERGVEWLRLDGAGDGWRITWRNRIGEQSVPLGRDRWEKDARVTIDDTPWAALRAVVGERKAAGSGAWVADDTFHGRIVFYDGVAFIDFTLHFVAERVDVDVCLALKEVSEFKLSGTADLSENGKDLK